MVANWLSGLTPAARKVWDAIRHHQHHRSLLGRYSDTRALLALGRLSHGTWNTYANSIKPFLRFLQTNGLEITDVTETTVEAFVCWAFEQPEVQWAGGTMASHISAVRTVWNELGMKLNPQDGGTGAALAGYRRITAATTAPKLIRPPWPSSHSCAALKTAQPLLAAYAANQLSIPLNEVVIAAAHCNTGSLTFSRGDTTNSMLMEDLEINLAGWMVSLVKQKRPQPRLPHQQHVATNDPDDPVEFVRQFHAAQCSRGFRPDSLLFGRTPDDRTSLTLDMSVQIVLKHLRLPQSTSNPLTGHCVRVGAVTEAFALGVPLLTCAFMCGHKQTSSTAGYVRHGHVPSHTASMYYLHLKPGGGKAPTL